MLKEECSADEQMVDKKDFSSSGRKNADDLSQTYDKRKNQTA